MSENFTVEKGPGHDWAVHYRFDDGFEDEVLVFGVLTIEKAIQEARYSIEAHKQSDGSYAAIMPYDLLGVRRLAQGTIRSD